MLAVCERLGRVGGMFGGQQEEEYGECVGD
jgi:hypothetical protein